MVLVSLIEIVAEKILRGKDRILAGPLKLNLSREMVVSTLV
jgi:hypothetical protein